MKTALAFVFGIAFMASGSAQAALIITGVVDGPRSGGLPKAIELFATSDIADLSIYNVETPNNGGVPTGAEFALTGSVLAGDFLYIASEATEFANYFGFAPDFTGVIASINGDDNVILYQNGVTIDQFGQVGVDGSGTAWEYTDGFAYRVNGTGPDPVFVLTNFTYSGIDALDPQGATGVNGDAGITVPFGTFTAVAVPEPSSMAALAVVGIGGVVARRRRKVAKA